MRLFAPCQSTWLLFSMSEYSFRLQLSVPGGNIPFGSFWFGVVVSVRFRISIAIQLLLKMLKILVVLCSLVSVCFSCRLLVPAELLNGCIFDPMIVSVSHAGFSINRENCNSAIAKHIFAEQPLVYYGRARSVGSVWKVVNQIKLKLLKEFHFFYIRLK